MRRKTEENYIELAKEKNLIWVGHKLPPNSKTLTKWECKRGHVFESRYNQIHTGNGCPKCANISTAHKLRKKAEDYQNLANKRGFVWLGETLPPNSKTLTAWKCKRGHIFESRYNQIHTGEGCPKCKGIEHSERNTLPIEAYYELALSRGFTFLGPYPKHTKTPIGWECPNRHYWKASFNNIYKGTCCPICSGNAHKTAGDYAKLAEENGLIWLGPFPKNTFKKTAWQCLKGHEWISSYQAIQIGCQCPECHDRVNGQLVSKQQRELCEMLKGQLNYRPPRSRYAIDVVLFKNDRKIAVEYDSWYWHKDRLDRDKKRDRLLIKRGWKVLRVKSNMLLPTKRQLNTAIKTLLNGESYAEIVLEDWGED